MSTEIHYPAYTKFNQYLLSEVIEPASRPDTMIDLTLNPEEGVEWVGGYYTEDGRWFRHTNGKDILGIGDRPVVAFDLTSRLVTIAHLHLDITVTLDFEVEA